MYIKCVSWIRDRRFSWIRHSSGVSYRHHQYKWHSSWPAASLLFRLGRRLHAPHVSGHSVHRELFFILTKKLDVKSTSYWKQNPKLPWVFFFSLLILIASSRWTKHILRRLYSSFYACQCRTSDAFVDSRRPNFVLFCFTVSCLNWLTHEVTWKSSVLEEKAFAVELEVL